MRTRALLSIAAVICLWQIVYALGISPRVVVASPWEVVVGIRDLCTVGMPPGRLLPAHIFYSLARVLVGVYLAVIAGIPLGLILGASRQVRAFAMPFVNFLRPIPPLAWIPLAILWFGIGMASAAFLIFLGAIFPIVLSTCSGVRGVDPQLADVVRTLGASRFDIWRRVLFPGAMPSILTGIRVGLGIGWMTLVAAEFTGVRSGYGLGYMIMSARDLQQFNEVLAGMAAIGFVGIAMEWILSYAFDHLLRWMQHDA